MHSFKELVTSFTEKFNKKHFPAFPATLYEPCDYFLAIGGKRIRPVLCLMGNELFDEINPDAWYVANAIEMFHNFTLIHDDMMDAATLRRNMQTVHIKYNSNTALLSGDVMMIKAIENINKINTSYQAKILYHFNTVAREVCEGQQLDMDFEQKEVVSLDEYIHMITLKTSVLLAASLKMGAHLGGASEGNSNRLYDFGKYLGIAFQVQDDYLDAFGDPEKFGKEVGGDIKQNKKTFLMLHTLEKATAAQKIKIQELIADNPADKVAQMLEIFKDCGADAWAKELKTFYLNKSLQALEEVAVISSRKKPLLELTDYLMQRES